MKTWIILGILLLAFGYVQNINTENGDLVKNQSGTNKSLNIGELDGIKIQETTVGEICGDRVGVGNIFKDTDGVLRVTLFVFSTSKNHRVEKGESIPAASGQIIVKEITDLPSKSNMPGSSPNYVVLGCLDNKKPYAAPEGVLASEINKPNIWNETEGKLTTIKGMAEETKEGIYVDGVLVKLDNSSKYAGKYVEVTGYLKTGAGSGGIDNKTGEVSQGYEGEYQYMTDIKEIKIVEE
ncbi:MAG: hypothetical protein AABW86_02640 [Candidatus Micrarchaeota archaeon]